MKIRNLNVKITKGVSLSKGSRIVLFGFLFLILTTIFYFWTNSLFPDTVPGILIYSSLIMLSFVILFIEHYFTKPTDVLSNTIAILLLLSPLAHQLNGVSYLFTIFYIYNFILALISLSSILLLTANEPETSRRNVLADQLKKVAVHFGNGKLLFFSLFFLTLFFYIDSDSKYFLILFVYTAIILLIDPKRFAVSLSLFNKSQQGSELGEIFGVQSKNTFLVKLYENRDTPLKIFDFVEFRYSINRSDKILKGIILDNYLLNKEQWVKVLVTKEIERICGEGTSIDSHKDNVVYKIREVPNNDFLDRFIGVVTENTTISKVRFIYNSKKEISEGQLLEVSIRDKKILYQIVQGITRVESLESKNETGFIIGEAVQLGLWNTESRNFEKYGWVPDINSPVYLASPIEEVTLQAGEYVVGKIPETNYPVIMDKIEAITHHIGILGVTGCGKSVFARNLIREFIRDGIKVICVDFTNEYIDKFRDLQAAPIISNDKALIITDSLNKITIEMDKFPNQREATILVDNQKIIDDNFFDAIRTFLESENNISIFELPDVSNTTEILEYTKAFFKILFQIARKEKSFGKKISVVLEEAHTVIPEWNFIGVSEKSSQSLVNSIGQIALQGRKYNIGFMVIAQRTANVSKTVLTQCNSLIAFQEFDKTSGEFLSNYLGKEMVEILPNLKSRQAIAVGKGFKSSIPLIFEVPEINE